LALSQAPPPAVIAIAMKRPTTITPISRPPSASTLSRPTMTGTTIGIREGRIISFCAAAVTIATVLPYSGFSVPSMIPGCSRNCLRTSSTTWPAARPTASIASAAKR
jgi:hypothetical protein